MIAVPKTKEAVMDIRKKFSAEFKARVALEAIRGQKTMSEISSEYKVHCTQVASWKKEALGRLVDVFNHKIESPGEAHSKERDQLYQQIGKLQVENDFLKRAVYRK
jgi:transposase-like protein